jgi:hypothetical protein
MPMAENFRKYLLDGVAVRELPRLEITPYHEATVARWRAEGLPDSVRTQAEFHDYFGLTSLEFFSIWPDLDGMNCRGKVGSVSDFNAVRAGLYDLEKVRRRMRDYREALAVQDRRDGLLWVPLHGFFWHPRDLMGIADHLTMFCTDPALMHEVNKELFAFNVAVVRMLFQEGIPAIICVSEDMAFRLGSMISRDMFEEFMAPAHRVLAREIRRERCVAAIDSDGDVTELVPWFAETGYQCISPMERQTGMDLMAMREASPGMAFLGGYNKLVMSKGPEAIRAEFESLKPLFRKGRFLPAVDHQTPPEVSLENYRHYLKAQEAFYAEMTGEL